MSNDAAMNAAEASLREVWPELTAKEASAEAVAAIAYASSHDPQWIWDGAVSGVAGRRQARVSDPFVAEHVAHDLRLRTAAMRCFVVLTMAASNMVHAGAEPTPTVSAMQRCKVSRPRAPRTTRGMSI
jgi:hypothetical protein